MIKRFIFNLFKVDFLKFAFNEQSKPVGFDKMDFAFLDSNGIKYYKFRLDDDIPLLRKGKLEQHIKELQLGLSSDNLNEILDYMEAALDNGNKPQIARIGHAITEMRNRKTMLLHPEIMFDLVSTLYIREDEQPAKIDEEIHLQKVKQFKLDSQGGLYDFFYSSGLTAYIPYLKDLENGFQEFWENQMKRISGLSEQIKQYQEEKLKQENQKTSSSVLQ